MNYLSRYLNGEYAAVWRELGQLEDAQAVARETMRRVRDNLLLLIERLTALGYDFGDLHRLTEWRQRISPDVDPSWLVDQLAQIRPPHLPPAPNVQEQLSELEQYTGRPLPLALRAWYEQVGSVNLYSSNELPGWRMSSTEPLWIDPLDDALETGSITFEDGMRVTDTKS